MTTNQPPLSRRITASLVERREELQWEQFIVSMLSKLELSEEDRTKAIKRYEDLAEHIARELDVGQTDVHVVVQGSMRTQTTTAMWGNTKFDLDIVVKLSSPKYLALSDSKKFFADFGRALQGVEDAGEPVMKNRCWRLQYPGETFYFDVTPAIPLSAHITGTDLRVHDPDTVWSPSNPEEFADWFCTIAAKPFPFQERKAGRLVEARTHVDPVPNGRVGIHDILRRTVQLIKLHRDNYYRGLRDARQLGKPISVILVTLATSAYRDMVANEGGGFTSAIEVALELVDRLPRYVAREEGLYKVMNPALSGAYGENFAERWNTDGGVRQFEFRRWHERLIADLDALFSEEYSKKDESRVRGVFGEHGVEAWKSSLASAGLLSGLLATLPAEPRTNPKSPVPTGSRNQLA